MNMPAGTIQFRLFGVPVFITPFSWVFLAILGGAFRMREAADIRPILFFVVVGMVVLLFHEFGHALVGRSLGGRPHAIVIEGLGGVTHSDPPPTRWGYFMNVLAGPLATLLPGLITGVVLALQVGAGPLAGIVLALTLPLPFDAVPEWVSMQINPDSLYDLSENALMLYYHLFFISVWWCLFNLLPVFPLDGGHLLATLCPVPRVVGLVGLVVSLAVVGWACTFGGVFLILLFGYLAYVNFRILSGKIGW